MTRIITDGYETGDTLAWNTTTPTLSTTIKHTGGYSGRGGVRSVAAATEYYVREWIYIVGGGTVYVLRLSSSVFGGALINVELNNSYNKLDYKVSNTTVATGVIALAASTWYMLEVHVVIDNSSGTIEARIDGVSDVSYSGDTLVGSTPYNIDLMTFGTAGTTAVYTDDIAVNNTSGATDNSWPGDGRVIALAPNANGDKSDLVGSDSDSTDNYLLVDEIPNDGDTTYVQTDTAGNYDLYNFGACGLSNVDILRVWAEVAARKTETADDKIKIGIKPSGGTETWGADNSLLTSYTRVIGEAYTTDPSTSSAWTTGGIDGLQAGVKAA